MAVKSPLELLYWILSLAGMTVPPNAKYPRAQQCYCYMHAVNMVIFLLTNTYQILMSDEIVEEKLGIAQHVLSTVHIIGKHFNILFRTVEMRRYFEEIEDLWKEATKGGKNLDLFEKAAKSSFRSTVVLLPGYSGLAPLTVIIWIVSNLLSDERSLPMKTWTPFSNYWVSSFYQVFSFQCVVLSAGVIKSYERNIFLQIDAQLKVMQRLLLDRNQDELEHKKIYKYHQRILKLVELTNFNFGGQAMLEMGLSALQIALRLSSCIMALLGGNPMFASFFLNLVLATIAPYIICLHGTILLYEGENIYRAAYQNAWYDEKTKTSKDLLILQSMAHKPLEFHYKTVFKFSLFQFTTVMQAAYSYLVAIKYFAGSNGLDD